MTTFHHRQNYSINHDFKGNFGIFSIFFCFECFRRISRSAALPNSIFIESSSLLRNHHLRIRDYTSTSSSSSSSISMSTTRRRRPSGSESTSAQNNAKKTRGNRQKEEEMKPTTLLQSWAAHTHESFHDFSPEETMAIRRSLLLWYKANRRKLPWRGDAPPYVGSTAKNKVAATTNSSQSNICSYFTPKRRTMDDRRVVSSTIENSDCSNTTTSSFVNVTAYGIWVSEIMLQQTRVEAVIPYYLRWMERFPTVHALAAASEEDVNGHWAGLGFYRRARLLHQGAKTVVEKFNGIVPSTVEELLLLDGIGRYTASAIASFAYNVSVPVVDGNVCRVLARLRGIANHIKSPALKDNLGWKLAEQLVTPYKDEAPFSAGDVNQALMELGATFCAPAGTGIHPEDPLREFYMSTRLGQEVGLRMISSNTCGKGLVSNVPTKKCFPDEFLTQLLSRSNQSNCKLCDKSGIADVLLKIIDDIEHEPEKLPLQVDRLSSIGHAAFPTAPPKKEKREEIIAIAAISFFDRSCDLKRWLMVKRPQNGLLAGQWEFPSACLWASNDKNVEIEECDEKADNLPYIKPRVRKAAIDALLSELITSNQKSNQLIAQTILQCRRTCVGKQPIEHIFSHVRHTVWIEYGDIECTSSLVQLEWVTSHGKEVRWMTEMDMTRVGTTTGIKKVLAAVKKERL